MKRYIFTFDSKKGLSLIYQLFLVWTFLKKRMQPDILFTLPLGTFWISLNAYLKVTKVFLFSNRGLVLFVKIKSNVNTLPRDLKNTNVLIMKILSNGVASDEKCIETDVFIDIFLLNINSYISMVSCREIFVRAISCCQVHPIFLSFGFWYSGHFNCMIFFPLHPVLPILPCKM